MQRIRTGEIVTLKPKPRSEVDGLDANETQWVVEAICERVLFDDRKGIWLGLASKSGREAGFRWVLLEGDDNFFVKRNIDTAAK